MGNFVWEVSLGMACDADAIAGHCSS